MPTASEYLRLALRLARRGYGTTAPNPMVGAVLVKGGEIIGRGWHRRAGGPHAEIEALRDAQRRGRNPRGATLYVTLEPCCTHGRTPPCTAAILEAGIRRVVIGATDPNPRHCGRAFGLLERGGISVEQGVLGAECERLNQAFNHWIVHSTPFVTVKAAMTLDGKIATATGESKWITGEQARDYGMRLRQAADAILVGINSVLADDPRLTCRPTAQVADGRPAEGTARGKALRRIILDSSARTPLDAKVVSDAHIELTTIVVTEAAPKSRVKALERRVRVWTAPTARGSARGGLETVSLPWLLRRLGGEQVTHLLVEGGGEIQSAFLLEGLAHRVAFFYAPMILGGRKSRKAVAGVGAAEVAEVLALTEVQWRRLGRDWLLNARIARGARTR